MSIGSGKGHLKLREAGLPSAPMPNSAKEGGAEGWQAESETGGEGVRESWGDVILLSDPFLSSRSSLETNCYVVSQLYGSDRVLWWYESRNVSFRPHWPLGGCVITALCCVDKHYSNTRGFKKTAIYLTEKDFMYNTLNLFFPPFKKRSHWFAFLLIVRPT